MGMRDLRAGDALTAPPRPLDGIELVRLIRADRRLATLPVMIVSYKDRDEDRLRGLDAGASYYLPKSSFQDERFLHAVEELIGGPEPS